MDYFSPEELCMIEMLTYFKEASNDSMILQYIKTNSYFIKAKLTDDQIQDSVKAFKDLLYLETG